jgi:hypothetical protein
MRLFIFINTLLFFLIPAFKAEKKNNSTATKKVVVQTTANNALLSKQSESLEKLVDTVPLKSKHTSGNALLILSGITMGLASLGLLHTNKKKATSLTRWAKANATKTQFAIAGMQTAMVGLAFYAGHNFKMLGYNFSENLHYIFPAIAAVGFLTVPLLSKSESIVLPKTIRKRKFSFLTIAIASLLNISTLGNHFVQNHPTTMVASAMQSMDETIIGAAPNNAETVEKENEEKTETKQKNKRIAVGVGVAILLTLAFLLLIVTLCAGVCLMAFAVTGAFTSGAIGYFLGGLALAFGSVFGMGKIIQRTKNKNKR